MALCLPLLLAVDGLVSYVTAFRLAFRSKLPHWGGEVGRCKLVAWPHIAIVQAVKQRAEGVWVTDIRDQCLRAGYRSFSSSGVGRTRRKPVACSRGARGMRCRGGCRLRGLNVKAAGQVPAADFLKSSRAMGLRS